MTYMINARLEQGCPSLTLLDAATGEKRLHWRGDLNERSENEWRGLFKQLVLLSCADQLSQESVARLEHLNSGSVEPTELGLKQRLNEIRSAE